MEVKGLRSDHAFTLFQPGFLCWFDLRSIRFQKDKKTKWTFELRCVSENKREGLCCGSQFLGCFTFWHGTNPQWRHRFNNVRYIILTTFWCVRSFPPQLIGEAFRELYTLVFPQFFNCYKLMLRPVLLQVNHHSQKQSQKPNSFPNLHVNPDS